MSIMSRYSLFAILLLLVVGSVSAQLNPASIGLTCVKNDSVSFTIESANTPQFVKTPDHHLATELFYLGNGVYEYTYIAGSDYLGLDDFVIKYYNPSNIPGNWAPAYSSVQVIVEDSNLDIKDDFVSTSVFPVTINPLINDSSSAGELRIIEIGNSKNCIVSLVDSVTIVVNSVVDSEQLAYVQYVVQDELSHSTSGMIIIRSDDYIQKASLTYVIHKNDQVKIVLANEDYSYSSPQLGSISTLGSGLFTYEADNLGQETIIFMNDDFEISQVAIEVIEEDINSGFLRDDLYFTTEQEEVLFDVFENDLEDNYYLVDFSPELTHDTLGMFSYQPQQWETGYRTFFYTVYNGFEHQTANIQIKIDNYAPLSAAPYSFSSFKNNPYFIDYRIPVTEFTMDLASSPSHGTVTVHGFNPTITNACGDYNGNYVVEYNPLPNYYGSDYFELEYCALESGKCNIVKINMNISADNNTCDCIGADCVWPGDTNNDGKVSHDDLLALGYCLGQSGPTRDVTTTWQGGNVSDWNTALMEEKLNAKYVDANGDGIITEADVQDILENLGAQHNLISTDAKPLSKLGLGLHTDQDTVLTGEWLFLDVSIGSEVAHLVDIQGLSYTLNFPPTLIDSASFFIDYHSDSWFVEGSPTLEITNQPSEGVIQSAFTRTSKNPVNGDGFIATLGFIVEDDLIGIRLKDGSNAFNFNIKADQIKVMGLDGIENSLLSSDIELVLKIKDKTPSSSSDLVLYPNPANDFVQIFSNMPADMQRIELYSMEGRLLQQHSSIDSKTFQLNVAGLQAGFYIVTAYSADNERISQKLQVVR